MVGLLKSVKIVVLLYHVAPAFPLCIGFEQFKFVATQLFNLMKI